MPRVKLSLGERGWVYKAPETTLEASPRPPLQSYTFVLAIFSVNCGIVELWNYLLHCPPRNPQSFSVSNFVSLEGLGGIWGQGQCNK